MAAFYAIILDWELVDPPQVRLVATAATAAGLRGITSYNPVGPFTTINRSDFHIEPQDAVVITNQFTHNGNPAHIAGVSA